MQNAFVHKVRFTEGEVKAGGRYEIIALTLKTEKYIRVREKERFVSHAVTEGAANPPEFIARFSTRYWAPNALGQRVGCASDAG